jgi:hypothetical protein
MGVFVSFRRLLVRHHSFCNFVPLLPPFGYQNKCLPALPPNTDSPAVTSTTTTTSPRAQSVPELNAPPFRSRQWAHRRRPHIDRLDKHRVALEMEGVDRGWDESFEFCICCARGFRGRE